MISIIIPANCLVKKMNPRYFYKKIFSLADTVESIITHIDVEYEIIIVINNSEDPALLNYVKNNPFIHKYCVINQNAGVARAWNIGAHLAEGDFYCFCNDDVEFEKNNAFSALIGYLQQDKTIGEIGPEGGKWHLDTSGERLGKSKPEKADEISGYFFIIPAAVYHETGGFDNYYTPAGCEEIDMSFKIRSLGYHCLVVPGSGIIHHGTHGISSRNADIKYFNKTINSIDLDTRNKAYFLSKWYPKN